MKIQARELFRFARRKGYIPVGLSVKYCAVSTLAKMVGLRYTGSSTNKKNIARKVGVSVLDLESLETGFEGWYAYENELKNRYYKVGQNLAKMCGYTT